jgi:hypothetical protein
MRRARTLAVAVLTAAVVAPAAACAALPSAIGSGGTSVNGGNKAPASPPAAKAVAALPGAPRCSAFPADNVWHADVSKLPVSTSSPAWLASTGASTRLLHPDFGGPYGIPITYVAGTHAKVSVTFQYAGESDRVGYPFGSDTRLEGGSDRHAIVVDRDTCRLYETWATAGAGSRWSAGSGAVYDLRSNALRPDGWTSADAAGLPILPGLLRYDEVERGAVDHAIRFTVQRSAAAHVWPARHDAGSGPVTAAPPMGARFRLKASYPVTGLRADTRTVLNAMKTYGLVVADNGSNWYFQGETDARWPDGLLDELKRVPASAFEAVDASRLQAAPDSGRVR